MQSWHFAHEIIVVAREHLNLARTGTDKIKLADIALIVHQLNQLSEFNE